jgi:hypothetical protein
VRVPLSPPYTPPTPRCLHTRLPPLPLATGAFFTHDPLLKLLSLLNLLLHLLTLVHLRSLPINLFNLKLLTASLQTLSHLAHLQSFILVNTACIPIMPTITMKLILLKLAVVTILMTLVLRRLFRISTMLISTEPCLTVILPMALLIPTVVALLRLLAPSALLARLLRVSIVRALLLTTGIILLLKIQATPLSQLVLVAALPFLVVMSWILLPLSGLIILLVYRRVRPTFGVFPPPN